MSAFSSLYEALEVSPKILKLLTNKCGIDVESISGSLLVVLYRTLIGSYGLSEMQAMEIVDKSKVAAELVEEMTGTEDLKAVPVVITDRKYASIYIKNTEEISAAILDLETMEELTPDKYFELCPAPITSDAIDLTAILIRIIITHLETVSKESSTESQDE